jgi:hypothetical protein
LTKPGDVTDQTAAPSTAENHPSSGARRPSLPLGRTFVWLGIASASAALTFFVLRATMRPQLRQSDETTDRIQALIDEANRLIKTLDEKKTP